MEFHERHLLHRHGLLHWRRGCDGRIDNCDALKHHQLLSELHGQQRHRDSERNRCRF
jgi:hypothetical protein